LNKLLLLNNCDVGPRNNVNVKYFNDFNAKLSNFQFVCDTVRRTLYGKVRTEFLR